MLNGDGAADLITGDYLPISMGCQVSIRLNDGSGGFSSAQAYGVYGSPADADFFAYPALLFYRGSH